MTKQTKQTVVVAGLERTYRGRPGCGCGCRGTHADAAVMKSTTTRRINEALTAIALGETPRVDGSIVALEGRTRSLWLYFDTTENAKAFVEAAKAAPVVDKMDPAEQAREAREYAQLGSDECKERGFTGSAPFTTPPPSRKPSAPSTAPIVHRSSFTYANGTLVSDASDLGFKPGQWPEMLVLVCDIRASEVFTFEANRYDNGKGLVGAVYSNATGLTKMLIAND